MVKWLAILIIHQGVILASFHKQIKWSALNSVIEKMVFMFLGENIFFGYGNPIEPQVASAVFKIGRFSTNSQRILTWISVFSPSLFIWEMLWSDPPAIRIVQSPCFNRLISQRVTLFYLGCIFISQWESGFFLVIILKLKI